MKNARNIIEALGIHEDNSAIQALEELGTNSPDPTIREWTSRALVQRNTHDSLRLVLIAEGKGIHDLDEKVVESTINALAELEDKAEAIRILDDTINMNSNEQVRQKANEVKLLLDCSR